MRSLIPQKFTIAGCAAALGLAAVIGFAAEKHEGPPQPWSKFKVHDMDRPVPPIITPGTASTPEQPGKPPSDAIVLFDGTDLSHWQAQGGGEPTFKLENGAMLSYGPKNLQSKDKFGDVQLHVEFACPLP